MSVDVSVDMCSFRLLWWLRRLYMPAQSARALGELCCQGSSALSSSVADGAGIPWHALPANLKLPNLKLPMCWLLT